MVYSFTKLNDIKPAMVAEATKDERKAAEQFAQDSGTGVGGIKSATQGYFSIGARDGDDMGNGADSTYKKVRVVTRSEEDTSELQALMRIQYAASRLKNKHIHTQIYY